MDGWRSPDASGRTMDNQAVLWPPSAMEPLFLLSGAQRRDPAVDAWFEAAHAPLRMMARPWFDRLVACGPDVEVLLHDGHPTACVRSAAFAYVDAFAAHANLGFFHGAALPDPAGLLQGAGKRMRHVKIRWGEPAPEAALNALIAAAYADIVARLSAEG